jgi:hypothetical protein
MTLYICISLVIAIVGTAPIIQKPNKLTFLSSYVLTLIIILFIGFSYQVGAPDWISYSAAFESCSADLLRCYSSLFTWSGGFEPFWRAVSLVGASITQDYYVFQFFFCALIIAYRHRYYRHTTSNYASFLIALDFFVIIFPLLNVWRQLLALTLSSSLVLKSFECSFVSPQNSKGLWHRCHIFAIWILIFLTHLPTGLVSLFFICMPLHKVLDILRLRFTKNILSASHVFILVQVMLAAFIILPKIGIDAYVFKYLGYLRLDSAETPRSYLNILFLIAFYSFSIPSLARHSISNRSSTHAFDPIVLCQKAFVFSLLIAFCSVLWPVLYPLLFRIRFVAYNFFFLGSSLALPYIFSSLESRILSLLSLLASFIVLQATINGSPYLYLPYCTSISVCTLPNRAGLIYAEFK